MFPVSDSTVSPMWQSMATSPSSSSCCFEVSEPGLNSAVAPPEGGFVDLNATCSHNSNVLRVGALACDNPQQDSPPLPLDALTMANRTLFIRRNVGTVGRGVSESWGLGVAAGGGGGGQVATMSSGLSTTHSLSLMLLLSIGSWTNSHKLRLL